MANNDILQVDVLISGGGAAGYSLALALSAQGSPIKIALVEAHDPTSKEYSPGFDARLIALSAQSLQFYQQFNFNSEIEQACNPIEHIHVSDQGKTGQCSLHAEDLDRELLGGVIALEDLGGILKSHISADCSIFQPDSISEVKQQQDRVVVTLNSGQKIQTKLLVIAEGANSQTASLLQSEATQEPYQQHAIVANIRLEDSHQNWAFERFTPQGPLALLPMKDNCASMVWCVKEDESEGLLQLSSGDFLAHIQQQFGMRLGRFKSLSKRFHYPLVLTRCDDSVLHRCVVVANSAQSLHPIAGQGFNLGLRDIHMLQQIIAGVTDPGSYSALREFQRARQLDRDQTITMTDGLVRLFSNENPLLTLLRNTGLIKMSLSPAIKNSFAKRAMGFGPHQGVSGRD